MSSQPPPSGPPSAARTRTLGRVGERLAARHLQRQGMVVVHRNWRGAVDGVRGELDVVAREGNVLVVCEVKARRGGGTGGAFAAITPDKLARLRRLAAVYLVQERPSQVADVRFDAIGVTWPTGGGRPILEHLRGIG